MGLKVVFYDGRNGEHNKEFSYHIGSGVSDKEVRELYGNLHMDNLLAEVLPYKRYLDWKDGFFALCAQNFDANPISPDTTLGKVREKTGDCIRLSGLYMVSLMEDEEI